MILTFRFNFRNLLLIFWVILGEIGMLDVGQPTPIEKSHDWGWFYGLLLGLHGLITLMMIHPWLEMNLFSEKPFSQERDFGGSLEVCFFGGC